MGHKLSISILLASAIGLSLFGGYKVGELNASLEATRHIDSLRQERLSTVSDLKSQISMQDLEIRNFKIEIDATNKFYGEKIGELQNQLMVSQVKLKRIFESDPLKGKLDGYFEMENFQSDNELRDDFGFNKKIEKLAHVNERLAKSIEFADSMIKLSELQKEQYIAGRPINWGWLSSKYGYRNDPFTGKKAWHSGVDFAGRSGEPILATASGIVTFSGKLWGYGNIVIIEHQDGYETRYAHCKELLVSKGDLVRKGDKIALMGSTGRSTGPHVHYEVVQGYKKVDPEKYIYR